MLASDLFESLKEHGTNFFCGVPDSLLKDFCAYITDNTQDHIITANEGNAIALACGHYLATGNIAVVYMQNSGLGNCVNPLLSLADEDVYSIPLLMFVGWRGEPGTKDEPQHVKQGKVTDKLLEAMCIKYEVLPTNAEDAKKAVDRAYKHMVETNQPFALIVKKGTFEKYSLQNKRCNNAEMSREEAISMVAENLNNDDIVVSTTGQISRELYEFRDKCDGCHKKDFLTVGSMGHASSIALGIALEKKNRNVICFDGDGALLMHMGCLPVISSQKLKNFKHVVFNNEAHDSVGSQPTSANEMNLVKTALACGYDKAYSVDTQKDLLNILPEFMPLKGTALLEIKVKCGARKDLGRPKEKPCENKESFRSFVCENKTFFERGSIKKLPEILKEINAKNVLVFTGKKSFEEFRELIESNLDGFDVDYYSDFSVNPKEEDVSKAIGSIKRKHDVIVAIGGGSVIDFAKLYRFSIDNGTNVSEHLERKNKKDNKKTTLIAVPTTSGTGSEATKFAVVYIDGIKNSLDGENILPDYSIIDSQFTENSPKYLKACSAMDAYCQAIEAYWSVNSTKESRDFATEAIRLCKENLVKYVNSSDKEAALNMSKASNLAGKAINISKTTAAHAASYILTSKYGIPHGHAVALSIGNLFNYNLDISRDNVQDKRGIEYVLLVMNELLRVMNIKQNEVQTYFRNLFNDIGLEYNLEKLGIDDTTIIANEVNEDRLKNNPRKLSKKELELLIIN